MHEIIRRQLKSRVGIYYVIFKTELIEKPLNRAKYTSKHMCVCYPRERAMIVFYQLWYSWV